MEILNLEGERRVNKWNQITPLIAAEHCEKETRIRMQANLHNVVREIEGEKEERQTGSKRETTVKKE